jgi:recombination protein RecA
MLPHVQPARVLAALPATPLLEPFPPGKLVELSSERAGACLSAAVSAVRLAQSEGEPTAWIQPAGGSLYPPDLSDCGVDLAALPVIHVPGGAGEYGLLKAAELLLRSGAFGLVVLDLRDSRLRRDAAWQGRLLALAREHCSRVVLLSAPAGAHHSLGPLVSVRIEPRRLRVGPGIFVVEHHLLKNKQGLALDGTAEHRRGPWGLR